MGTTPASSFDASKELSGYGAVPEMIPVRMLTQFSYCPRLGYLEWVQGEFVESADTLEGTLRHKRVDRPSGTLRMETDSDDADEEAGSRLELQTTRSITLGSEEVGLIARIDLVELEGKRATPVDYKRGSGPKGGGAWDADKVQICSQALILRASGYECDRGIVYYCESKKRVAVPIDKELISRTLSELQSLRDIARSGIIPPPLVDSPKCDGCSLAPICLPDETRLLAELGDHELESRGANAGRVKAVRHYAPPASHAFPLYVQEQGASIGKDGETLTVKVRGELQHRVRLLEVSQVCLIGNVQVSSQAIRELAQWDIPICYFSYGGWFSAICRGMAHKNVELRQRQYAAANGEPSLVLAKEIVDTKILNARTMLRRNHREGADAAIAELQRLRRRVPQMQTLDSLLGIEGSAARVYFSHFSGMLKGSAVRFDFTGRNRRPPRDPVNALLSFAYSLLVKDLTCVLLATGFDPYLGFYHQPKYGRPALALDLAEEFRPILADSTVIQVLNTGILKEDDFVQRGPACSLSESGRKKFIAAYERRMDTEIKHPIFGYSLSYRRVLFVQARLLSRYLMGELPSYPGFVTR